MNDTVLLLLVALVLLAGIAVAYRVAVMVGRLIAAFRRSWILGPPTYWNAPGLGDLCSYDQRMWMGTINDLDFSLHSEGDPPTASQLEQVKSIAHSLSDLTTLATSFLRTHFTVINELPPEASFLPLSVDLECSNYFVLTVQLQPSECDEGAYWVRFNQGIPIECGWDH